MTTKLKIFQDLLSSYSNRFIIYRNSLILDTDLIPKKGDNSHKLFNKSIKKALLESSLNKPVSIIEEENKKIVNSFGFIRNSIINIKFDDYNYKNYTISLKPLPFIRTPDNFIYKYMYKLAHYQDISPIYMLKKLYQLHKISRAEFKKAIKSIKSGNKPKAHIIGLFNCMLKTIKAPQNKSSISALKRKDNKKTNITLSIQNNPYRVNIKNRFKTHINHIEKMPLIENEFKVKFFQDNNINNWDNNEILKELI